METSARMESSIKSLDNELEAQQIIRRFSGTKVCSPRNGFVLQTGGVFTPTVSYAPDFYCLFVMWKMLPAGSLSRLGFSITQEMKSPDLQALPRVHLFFLREAAASEIFKYKCEDGDK